MNSARLEQLLTFYKETPNDPFILYALALEYKRIQPKESNRLFRQLMQEHPDYLPTYYQAAAFHEEQGNLEEARRLYELGIQLASRLNDQSALRELKAAYGLLNDDD